MLVRRGDTPLVISHFSTVVAGIDARDGKVLWEYAVNSSFRRRLPLGNCAQLFGGLLINTSSTHYGGPITQSAMALSRDGTAVSPAWNNPVITPYQGGILVYDGKIYGTGSITWTAAKTTEGLLINGVAYAELVDRLSGDAAPPRSEAKRNTQSFKLDGQSRGLVCQDARTGRVLGIRYGMPLNGWGGCTSHLLVAADDRIIATGTSNMQRVWLLEPGPAMAIKGTFDTPKGKSHSRKVTPGAPDLDRWSSPALADGLLYLRLNDLLLAYDLRSGRGALGSRPECRRRPGRDTGVLRTPLVTDDRIPFRPEDGLSCVGGR
jgi:hypothetical protein